MTLSFRYQDKKDEDLTTSRYIYWVSQKGVFSQFVDCKNLSEIIDDSFYSNERQKTREEGRKKEEKKRAIKRHQSKKRCMGDNAKKKLSEFSKIFSICKICEKQCQASVYILPLFSDRGGGKLFC